MEQEIELFGVFGNRDNHEILKQAASSTSMRLPENNELLTFHIDGQHFAAYHGHHKPTLRKLSESAEYDVLLTGHTHKPLIQTQGSTLVINPGSTAFTIPRRREPRSIALYDTETRSAELVYFDPL